MTTYTDSFTRDPSVGLGPDWSNPAGNNFNIVVGNGASPVTGTNIHIVRYEHSASDADHYAEVVIASLGTSSIGPMIRANQGTSDGTLTCIYAAYAAGGQSWQIIRRINGSPTQLANVSDPTPPTVPFTLRLSAVGNQITLTKDGVVKATATDSHTGTYSGMYAFNSTGQKVTSFTMADNGGTPPPALGTFAGSLARTGTASGYRASRGSVSGVLSETGDSSGARASRGLFSGLLARAGAFVGLSPTVGGASGTFAGFLSRSGSFTGARRSSAAASGALSRTGAAVGYRASRGALSGSLRASGDASGYRASRGIVSGLLTRLGSFVGHAPIDTTGFRDLSLTARMEPERLTARMEPPRLVARMEKDY